MTTPPSKESSAKYARLLCIRPAAARVDQHERTINAIGSVADGALESIQAPFVKLGRLLHLRP